MMTDRELLELAAKVAGFDGEWRTDFDGQPCLILPGRLSAWNALADDGDAFRLAVDLQLLVGPNSASREPTVFAWARDNKGCAQYQAVGADRGAATRRAIVREAAAMAEQRASASA